MGLFHAAVAAAALLLLSMAPAGCAGTAPLPPRAAELNRQGAAALAAGDLETAEARLGLALEYHPRFVEALVNLALVEMQRGNLERARVVLERARRINADVAQPHHGLGVLRERERRPDLAAEHYRDALRVDPGFGPSRANLGRVLFAAGRFDEARDQFVRLVQVAPGEMAGHTGLTETLLRLGRDRDADEVVARARAAFGDAPELVVLVARSRMRAGDLAEAEALLDPLAAGRDDVGRAASSWLAAVRLARGDPSGAAAAAGRALAIDRNDPVATYVVAMALRARRDPRAAAWLERVRLLSPADSVVAEELGRARAEGSPPTVAPAAR